MPEEPLAIISDLHGNITALEAVLDDIKNRGINQIVVLGDLVGKGPNPAACVDLVRSLGCPVILGNWDEMLAKGPSNLEADSDFAASVRWNQAQLGEARLRYLEHLPFSLDFKRPWGLLRLLHASPQSVFHRLGLSKILSGDHNAVAEMFLSTANVADLEPDVVGYGDIHAAFVLHFPDHLAAYSLAKNKTLFNVGSVGNPLDQAVPVYGIVGGGAGLEISLVRVPYDIELECRRASGSGMPQLEEYLEETRFARYRPRG